ncbi:MAG: hypothetical protein JJT78_11545 [Leptospira sp.]|nr:hypothetical protein [Leptospira sp.]
MNLLKLIETFQGIERFKILLIVSLFALNQPLFSQEEREYKVSPKAYGITYDGTYLYYLDSERRAIIRFDSIGGQEIFNIGLAQMKGITFDSREGRLLVTAPRVILKIDPNSGGVVDRIQVPLTHMGGIASVDGLYYLLDLKDGKVNFFDKASSIIVGGFLSDRVAPRDLTYGKDSIWISDSSNGVIYRYNPNNGKITGSVQAAAGDMRGILFSGSKLWVIDRASQEIKNISFVETERFIASGESNYEITYTLDYSLPNVSLANSEIAILLPPSNEQQRIRTISSTDKDFKNGVLFRTRSLNKKLNLDSGRGNQSTKISFQVRLSNMVYYVNDNFLKKKESIPNELNDFRNPSKELTNLSTNDTLARFNSIFQNNSPRKIRNDLFENGFPVQTGKKIIYKDGAKAAEVTDYVSGYLPGFGWIPFSNSPESKDRDNRVFHYTDKEIVLFQSNTSQFLSGPVFFREKSNDEWSNLSTRWSVTIKKIQ